MLNRATMFAAAASLVCASFGAAAEPLRVKPWIFDPDNLGIVDSAWNSKIGLRDAGKSNHGLYLQKAGNTTAFAAAGAEVTFAGTLTELGFDFDLDGHCGAGAPRFNVYTTTGTYYFFGCASGIHTPVPGAPGWERVRFLAADGFPSDGISFISSFEDIEVTGIDIVFDEGTDVGPGFAVLDNIDINGTLIGKPGNAK